MSVPNLDALVVALRRKALEKSGELSHLVKGAIDGAINATFRELTRLTTPEFAMECRTDPVCRETWVEILETTHRLNEEVRKAVTREVADMLMRLGMDVVCDDYGHCYLLYKSFAIDLKEVSDIIGSMSGVQ